MERIDCCFILSDRGEREVAEIVAVNPVDMEDVTRLIFLHALDGKGTDAVNIVQADPRRNTSQIIFQPRRARDFHRVR